MRRVSAPDRSLTLRGIGNFSDETLRVTPSNQGEPYRQTLRITFERGAHGNWEDYDHIASIELDADEETALRDMLNARNPQVRP